MVTIRTVMVMAITPTLTPIRILMGLIHNMTRITGRGITGMDTAAGAGGKEVENGPGLKHLSVGDTYTAG